MNQLRIGNPKLPGHPDIYLVLGHDGSIEFGKRLINWGAYIPVAEADLPRFMIDNEGVLHEGSIPPGSVRLDEEARLKQLMRAELPTFFGEIVTKTENTSVQLIPTARIPAYARGRACLIGDAGMITPPFTTGGLFRGYTNTKDLLQAFHSYDIVHGALAHWEKDQTRIGNWLLRLSDQMEEAVIWNPVDLTNADAATTAAWWNRTIIYPEEFKSVRENTRQRTASRSTSSVLQLVP